VKVGYEEGKKCMGVSSGKRESELGEVKEKIEMRE
jgi:hypothetical protein